jgi:hypothetical protein
MVEVDRIGRESRGRGRLVEMRGLARKIEIQWAKRLPTR